MIYDIRRRISDGSTAVMVPERCKLGVGEHINKSNKQKTYIYYEANSAIFRTKNLKTIVQIQKIYFQSK